MSAQEFIIPAVALQQYVEDAVEYGLKKAITNHIPLRSGSGSRELVIWSSGLGDQGSKNGLGLGFRLGASS